MMWMCVLYSESTAVLKCTYFVVSFVILVIIVSEKFASRVRDWE